MAGRSKTSRSPFDPSRFVFEEASKRPSNAEKAVHFISGEASFSEQAPQIAKRRRRATQVRSPVWLKPSTFNLVAVLAILGLTVGLVYRPSTLPTMTHLSSIFATARHRIIVALSAPVTIPPPSCTISAGALHQIAQEAAALVRRSAVLLPDYALAANGGRIHQALTSPLPERARTRQLPQPEIVPPDVVIDELTTIGRCWITSVGGQVGLSTGTVMYPSNVTVEHIPRQVSIDISRAPRHMILWGVVDGLTNVHRFRRLLDTNDVEYSPDSVFHGRFAPPLSATHAFVALAAFEYDIWADSPVQTFAVHDRVAESQMDFGIFVLEVVDNWGGVDTCIYRIQIHGVPAILDS